MRREELDCHASLELYILCQIHLTHSTRAEFGKNAVMRQRGIWSEIHTYSFVILLRRRIHKLCRMRKLVERPPDSQQEVACRSILRIVGNIRLGLRAGATVV